MLSEAKHLARAVRVTALTMRARCFASLSMTFFFNYSASRQ